MRPLQIIRAILSNSIPKKITETFCNNMSMMEYHFHKVTGYKFAKAGFQIFFEHIHFRQRIHFVKNMQMFF